MAHAGGTYRRSCVCGMRAAGVPLGRGGGGAYGAVCRLVLQAPAGRQWVPDAKPTGGVIGWPGHASSRSTDMPAATLRLPGARGRLSLALDWGRHHPCDRSLGGLCGGAGGGHLMACIKVADTSGSTCDCQWVNCISSHVLAVATYQAPHKLCTTPYDLPDSKQSVGSGKKKKAKW